MSAFALRAPWYVRERGAFGLRDPRALRPNLQMYDGTNFVKRLMADPRDSLAYGEDDRWSYPVPVTPSLSAKGRARLATSQLITTNLRKLYQPSHNRFYVVVVEVFCDQPGLPRAGNHDDIVAGFVMRRRTTSVTGARGPARRLARNLLVDMAAQQNVAFSGEELPEDVRDLWWADRVWRARFEDANHELIEQLAVESGEQGWFTGPDSPPRWKPLDRATADDAEQEFPMWRLPRRPADCDAAATRSTWFGVVPTYSAEHSVHQKQAEAKLDDRAIYELACFVRPKPPRGKPDCPQPTYWSAASEPFRLASPMDPQGTSKRITTITLPDLRRLAARAGQPQGPGGVRIITPAKSALAVNPFKGIPTSGSAGIGAGGSICTFALELFFIVAFFLFLMFLPIVILAFQLWWMLALRFCIPPSISFSAMADFFASGKVLADLDAGGTASFDLAFGTDDASLPPGNASPGWVSELDDALDPSGNPVFKNDPNFVRALVVAADPSTAVPPSPPPLETTPDDPLCSA